MWARAIACLVHRPATVQARIRSRHELPSPHRESRSILSFPPLGERFQGAQPQRGGRRQPRVERSGTLGTDEPRQAFPAATRRTAPQLRDPLRLGPTSLADPRTSNGDTAPPGSNERHEATGTQRKRRGKPRRIIRTKRGESGGQLAWLARSEETEGVIRSASRACRGGLRTLPACCPYLAIFRF